MTDIDYEARTQRALTLTADSLPQILGDNPKALATTAYIIQWIGKHPEEFAAFDRDRWTSPLAFVELYQAVLTQYADVRATCPNRDLFAFLLGMARGAWLATA